MKKIIAKKLSLKDPRNFMKTRDDFVTRKLTQYFKLCTIGQPVFVQNLQETTRLRLMMQEIIKKKLEEIGSKDTKFNYVHL